MKKRFIVISFSLVIIVLIGIIIFLYQTRSSSYSGWSTYISNDYGLSVMYPPDWFAGDGVPAIGAGVTVSSNYDWSATSTIVIGYSRSLPEAGGIHSPPDGRTDLKSTVQYEDEYYNEPLSPITFAGLEAYYLNSPFDQEIWTVHDGHLYTILYPLDVGSTSELWKIISTIRFLNN